MAVSLVETGNGRERLENSSYLKKDLVQISSDLVKILSNLMDIYQLDMSSKWAKNDARVSVYRYILLGTLTKCLDLA